MTTKTTFFDEWFWLKFNNVGLAQGMALKFYTLVAKGLKLKVKKFVDVTGEKLVRRVILAPPPPKHIMIGVNGLVTTNSLKKHTKVKNKVPNTSKLITKWNFDANENVGLNREKLDKYISSSERETIFYKAYKTLVIVDYTTV